MGVSQSTTVTFIDMSYGHGLTSNIPFGNLSSVFVAINRQSSDARYEAAFMNLG